jgi:hypothetical protein
MARIDLDITTARTIGGALRQTIAAERDRHAAAREGVERWEIGSRLARLQAALVLVETAEDAAMVEYQRARTAAQATA